MTLSLLFGFIVCTVRSSDNSFCKYGRFTIVFEQIIQNDHKSVAFVIYSLITLIIRL